MSPWIIGFLIFTAGPMVVSLVLSFTDYRSSGPSHGVGTANYRELARRSADREVAGSTPSSTPRCSCRSARSSRWAWPCCCNGSGRAAGFFRTAFYLPVMTPAVAAAAMFLLLLNGQRGLVNQVLGWFGIAGPELDHRPAPG